MCQLHKTVAPGQRELIFFFLINIITKWDRKKRCYWRWTCCILEEGATDNVLETIWHRCVVDFWKIMHAKLNFHSFFSNQLHPLPSSLLFIVNSIPQLLRSNTLFFDSALSLILPNPLGYPIASVFKILDTDLSSPSILPFLGSEPSSSLAWITATAFKQASRHLLPFPSAQ